MRELGNCTLFICFLFFCFEKSFYLIDKIIKSGKEIVFSFSLSRHFSWLNQDYGISQSSSPREEEEAALIPVP
jgi:hypothetical protein